MEDLSKYYGDLDFCVSKIYFRYRISFFSMFHVIASCLLKFEEYGSVNFQNFPVALFRIIISGIFFSKRKKISKMSEFLIGLRVVDFH